MRRFFSFLLRLAIVGLMLAAVAWIATVIIPTPGNPKAQLPVAITSELIQRGEYIAKLGDCTACHTMPGGKPFAGGLAINSPIGPMYPSNITPDPKTGIGSYSYGQFEQAVRRGIRSDDATLYPAMPYPSYATISDEDVMALYAYFMKGVTPVEQANKQGIPWPLSIRWPVTYWRWLFAPSVEKATDRPRPADPQLARGAYLVEGLGHCGACHTPRAFPTLQEKSLSNNGKDYLEGSPIDNWFAADLSSNRWTGLGRWSEDDIVTYLKTGANRFANASGGMAQVVEDSTQFWSDADLRATAAYLKSLSSSPEEKLTAIPAGDPRMKKGLAVYEARCSACHGGTGAGVEGLFPRLAESPIVMQKNPVSLLHVTLAGSRSAGTSYNPTAPAMPTFVELSDETIADVLTFIRNSWGNIAPAVSQEEVANLRKTLKK